MGLGLGLGMGLGLGLGLGIGLPVLEESVVARLGLRVVEQREHLAPGVERRLHDPPLARVQERAWLGVGLGVGIGTGTGCA